MAISKKGTRKITVGNEAYRWLIRRKATNSQSDYGNGQIHVAIEHAEEPGTTLLIYTSRKHPKDWSTKMVAAVTPSDIAGWIVQALELDWNPKKPGPQLSVEMIENKMKITSKI